MFSHRTPSSVSSFVTLFTSSRANITASPSHYIWVMDDTGFGSGRPVTAQDIQLGDCLAGLDETISSVAQTCVVGKTERLETGLYNPHTASGSIVVNGIASLTFTDTLPPSLYVHSMVTMPARLVSSACKVVGGMQLCNALNDAFLSIYFNTPWGSFLNLLSVGQLS